MSNESRFTDSVVVKSQNGLRIKTDLNATGQVVNVTFSNIVLSDIINYGIDIQQNYPGSDAPSNGVALSGITFSNVNGTVNSTGMDYYILCGDGSCSDFTFDCVDITGGGIASSCNYPSTGCPAANHSLTEPKHWRRYESSKLTE
jgi:polygalacturonase